MMEKQVEFLNLTNYMQQELERIGRLFAEKQKQYSCEELEGDALANFRTGAQLLYGVDDNSAIYDTGKSYLGKHIAFLYDHDIDAPKAPESWGDVAVYALILKYMAEKHQSGRQL